MMASNVRDALRGVETVIIDEIHALVPNKRGAHMAVSLERLAMRCDKQPQRIGLSATQRPLEEVARFLGGSEVTGLRGSGDSKTSKPRNPETPEQLHDEFTDDKV